MADPASSENLYADKVLQAALAAVLTPLPDVTNHKGFLYEHTDLRTLPADAPISFGHGHARNRLCGSWIDVLAVTCDGRITHIFAEGSLCALGRASLSLLQKTAVGQKLAALERGTLDLEAMLRGERILFTPAFVDLALLEAAIPHTARHLSVLLPWKAACTALQEAVPLS